MLRLLLGNVPLGPLHLVSLFSEGPWKPGESAAELINCSRHSLFYLFCSEFK